MHNLHYVDSPGGVEELADHCTVYDYIQSVVAIFDADLSARFRNRACLALCGVLLHYKNIGCFSELDIVRSTIKESIEKAVCRELRYTFHYVNNIPLKLHIVITPVKNRHTDTVDGAVLTIGEECVSFNNRHLARMQHMESELVDRIRLLSVENIEKDKLVRSLLKQTPFGVMLLDMKRHILQLNDAAKKMFGLGSSSAIGDKCDKYVDCFNRLGKCPVAEGHRNISATETACFHADGNQIPVLRSIVLLTHGKEPIIMESFVDISETKKAHAKMHKLSSALEQTADSVLITKPDGIIEYVNAAFEKITGYNYADISGKTPKILKSGRHDKEFYQNMWRTLTEGKVYRDVLINRKKSGDLYYEEKTITPLKNDNGEITYFISTGKDITDRIQAQERLNFLAHHDALTELPNRSLFLDRLDHAINRSIRASSRLATLFVDLDRFKSINDSLGHAAGDQLLCMTAQKIKQCLRSSDTVSRLGGDEFAILLEDVDNTDGVAQITQTILDALEEPVNIDGRNLIVTSSIGISMFPDDGVDTSLLMKHADIAMYRAKEQGRNHFQFYSEDMGRRVFEHLIVENNLRHALDRNQYLLYYQPQIEIATRRIVGVESVVRWRHPDLGLVSPIDFVPVLEDTGLIVPVGKWILETACLFAKRIHREINPEIVMAVNISPKQFCDAELPNYVSSILEQHGVAPQFLEIELTESVLIENNSTIMKNFDMLSKLGVRLALDDFGTGYSSLSYLKRFPIQTLKIDRSFISDVTTNEGDAAIVLAILAISERLKLKVVAEGIETASQAEFLVNNGCGIVQGYFFSPPIPEAEFLHYCQVFGQQPGKITGSAFHTSSS